MVVVLVVLQLVPSLAVQPFLDYDCNLVHTIPGHAANWNVVFNRTVHKITDNFMETDFSFPNDFADLVVPSKEAAKQSRFVCKFKQAQLECPLGFLYLKLLRFHNVGADRETAETIQKVLRLYPSYVIALSRWPIFPLLAYHQNYYFPLRREPTVEGCKGVNGVINWDTFRAQAVRWAELLFQQNFQTSLAGPNADELRFLAVAVSEHSHRVLQKIQTQEQASEECPFGFHFLMAMQMVSAADKTTQALPPFSRLMDQVLQEVSFLEVSNSSWPVWHVLTMFSDMNKGHWFYGGDSKYNKYFRGFSDWNLRVDELSPLVSMIATHSRSKEKEFLSAEWRKEVGWKVEALKKMDHLSYIETLQDWRRRREDALGRLRPIAFSMIQTASAVAAHAYHKELQTRLAYVVLLYGDSWAQVLQRMVARMAQLKMDHPLLVIAIGAAEPVCREMMMEGKEVICWVPETDSQVHRFTGIHGLLHLGIDVIYLDMDIFLLRDPTKRFKAAAEGGWDALFSRHADADCINIGVFYLKASGNTAVWMSQYLEWYHDNPFEIDQRGMHVFLGLPAQALKVATVPRDLQRIKGSVLEDLNEVVIGDLGWTGSLNKMLLFHWCQLPLEVKVAEMDLAYDGADALEDHQLPLSLAISTAAKAPRESPWYKVVIVKTMLLHYRRPEVPKHRKCW